ncbi:MAG: DUF4126 domain-containing protein [Chloroflexi bacterium]|nr:DUF4126 domain-containing protein [Chloroflexota bacterium]
MVESLTSIFSAFGLSASAGLNAYLPLLIVALTARYTDWFQLSPPFDALKSPWAIGVLVVLLIVETVADKVPAVNHLNDLIQTVVRPTAGAVLFAASTHTITQMDPVVMMVLGLLVAGTVHATKSALVRPAVTATTGGVGNVPVSIAEDITAAVVSVLAIVVPVFLSALIVVVAAFVIWWLWRRANRAAQPR